MSVFAARTKDQAAKMFKCFLVWFENEFHCRVHVLRMDGGGEYRIVELFCKQTGVRRQITEAGSPASKVKLNG